MRSALRFALLGVLFAATLAVPQGAAAQGVPGQEVARQLFDEGVELEGQKRFDAALAKFREAEQIRATPALRFHKAFCLENLGKLAAALDEYEAAERSARDQNKAETLKNARARLETLRARVPQLAVKLVSPANGEVLLDGVVLAAPLVANGTRFRVDPGEHQLVARAPDHTTKTQKVTLAESASSTVEITLERAAVAPTAPPPALTPKHEATPAPAAFATDEPPAAPRPKQSVVLPIATSAGAVALVTAGVVSFVVAGNAANEAQTECPTKLSCDDERSRVRTFDALALAGFVSGAALGALSVVLWVSRPAAEPRSARVRVGPAGVFVEGAL